jgi:hypothetical protein
MISFFRTENWLLSRVKDSVAFSMMILGEFAFKKLIYHFLKMIYKWFIQNSFRQNSGLYIYMKNQYDAEIEVSFRVPKGSVRQAQENTYFLIIY